MVEAETKSVEIVFDQEGVEETVPDGEHAAVVGVVFALES